MKNSKDLESRNFVSKLKSWIYHLFKKDVCCEPSMDNEDLSNIQNSEVEATKNFLNEYKMKSDKRKYLLDLQKKFESKLILEKDINSEDQKALELLYMEQINELKRSISSVEYRIKKYN